MTFPTIRQHTLAGIIFLTCIQLVWASDFPDHTDQISFESDLQHVALVNNLPNLKGSDHYLGLKLTTSTLNTPSGQFVAVPEARISIYPNTGYNVWAHFARWPGDTPSFSYGTGAQMVFFAENGKNEQAIGFTWSMIQGEAHRQRDIKLYGLYAHVSGEWEYGLMGLLDMHHVIVEKNIGVSSYDGTIIQIAPYIKLMKWDEYSLSVMMPASSDGVAVSLNIERLLGKRD